MSVYKDNISEGTPGMVWKGGKCACPITGFAQEDIPHGRFVSRDTTIAGDDMHKGALLPVAGDAAAGLILGVSGKQGFAEHREEGIPPKCSFHILNGTYVVMETIDSATEGAAANVVVVVGADQGKVSELAGEALAGAVFAESRSTPGPVAVYVPEFIA